jgi:hypothetical protein
MLGWEPNQGHTWYDVEDLSRGLEKIPIHVGQSDSILTSFQYMITSKVHDKAHVNPTLSDLGPGVFCLCSSRNCLTAGHPCACMSVSGSGFAYMEGGLLKDSFLHQSISDSTYCKEERSCWCTNLGDYQGHPRRSFITECNVKCRCHSDCGNRVVQQGMRYRVEVFRTAHIGWGVRTIEAIPRGAFVFELAGEILTNAE